MVFEFFTPGIARICANAGAEFVMYCMEHTGAGFETLKPQFALCRALGVAPLVRVPATEYHFVARALDVGALGVMVPLVDTREQAERIVSFTRYPPQGRRGAAFGFAHDDYQGGDVIDKMRAIHQRTLVICMIETRAGLDNVDAIAAVPRRGRALARTLRPHQFSRHSRELFAPDVPRGGKAHRRRCQEARQGGGLYGGQRRARARISRPWLPHDCHRHGPGAAASRHRPTDQRMEKAFRVGVTSDIIDSRGEPAFGREPLKALDAVQWEWLPRGLREITAEHAAAFDALYVNSPRVPAAAVARPDLRLRLISRHGVGYDSVDVPAMTKAGVLVANTPNAVPRPVATIALTFVLALAHRLMAKDRITRAGRWTERLDLMGTGSHRPHARRGRRPGASERAAAHGEDLDLKLLAADPYAERLRARIHRCAPGAARPS